MGRDQAAEEPRAPLSPFAMPQYKLAATAKADRLEAQAAAFSESVGTFIQRADDYSLAVVLFAASLFFAGISTRLARANAADGGRSGSATRCSSAA